MMFRHVRAVLVLAACAAVPGCGDDATTIPARDITPPAGSLLAQGTTTTGSIELTWTAPGDDGHTGAAAAYDVRYAASPIALPDWDAATPVDGEPVPGVAGTAESFVVEGLTIGTTYHFALRARDEAANWSTLSNTLAAATTPAPDTTAPAAVTDLVAMGPTTRSLTLAWTAPGDDDAVGTAAAYDLRWSTSPITEENWDAAGQVATEPAPAPAGAAETCVVAGLEQGASYYCALKSRDEASNWSALSTLALATTDTMALGGFADIPAGTFTMGSPADEPFRSDLETQHEVTLTRGFRLQTTEVTARQHRDLLQWAYDHGWVTVTDEGVIDNLDGSTVVLLPLSGQGDISFADGVFNCRAQAVPISSLTWKAAASYCDWLSLRQGLPRAYDHATWRCNGDDPYAAAGYRLPTEAEWEYACRAGSATAFANAPLTYTGCSPLDPGLDLAGWYCGNSPYWRGAVAQKQPNAWGLYDMHGNVAELCHDWMGPYPGAAVDPVGVPAGSARVVRGGSTNSAAQDCRSAARAWGTGYSCGFRPAVTLTVPMPGFDPAPRLAPAQVPPDRRPHPWAAMAHPMETGRPAIRGPSVHPASGPAARLPANPQRTTVIRCVTSRPG